jgi:hypothetical protein
MKRFEEGVLSDLCSLKPGVDACLEEPEVGTTLTIIFSVFKSMFNFYCSLLPPIKSTTISYTEPLP